MTEHAVVIVGAGPTGLTLAAELALAKVDVVIVERNATQEREGGSRGLGLHARTIEVFDMRGIADRFISQGQTMQVARFHNAPLDISDFPTRHPYGLALGQNHTERILAGWVDELAVPVQRGREVTGFTQDDDGVSITVSDGSALRAAFLVGCDGGRSAVRKMAGIDFAGWDASISWMMAEVDTTEPPPFGFRENAIGSHAAGKGDTGMVRFVLTEPAVKTGTPTMAELSHALKDIYGTDFGVHSPRWLSRFNDTTRQAAAYRDRRVLLAGDAAHIHAPLGGQGLNIGVQDAMNLGWKVAQVVQGTSPDSLLDTYHAERHPVGAQVLRDTMAHVAVRRVDDRSKAIGDLVTELLGSAEPRKRLAGRMSGLDVRYALGDGHPLIGRRMPDLDVTTGGESRRVFTMLHEAKPLLLNFGDSGAFDTASTRDRVRVYDVSYAGPWELPVIGAVPAPAAVLVRPDGHVAWVGDRAQAGLEDALTLWFGPRR